jgi:hypothetical protein
MATAVAILAVTLLVALLVILDRRDTPQHGRFWLIRGGARMRNDLRLDKAEVTVRVQYRP